MSTPELADLILVLADNKHQLGMRYASWATSGPTLEAATAAAAMAQAELGHARALLPVLRDLSTVASSIVDEDRVPERYVRLLDHSFESWADFVAANALFDSALTVIVGSMADSSFVPMRGRAKKIMEEEHFHAAHGKGWLRRMALSKGAARAAIEEAVAALWLETLCLFGPDDDPSFNALYQARVIAAPGAQLREAFLARARPLLEGADLSLPPVKSLPWDRWDPIRRRLD